MIEIINKEDCCGCGACVQRCPKHCISMCEDSEGFYYPNVDKNLCIDCGLCEKVCPVIHKSSSREPLRVYAGKNPNERVRLQSSSGGIFTLLAEYFIRENGVVFGARFDNEWGVVHDYTETIDGIVAFRSSKYVQSKINSCYSQAEIFLKKGKRVLFTGTPCQIAGLKKFLRKDYDNLLAVEIFCHGVPSQKVWKVYLKDLSNKQLDGSVPSAISFRDKTTGWRSYSFSIDYGSKHFIQASSKNLYMKGFLSHLYLRPSCHKCPAKQLSSDSDLSIGDYWGINKLKPGWDDGKGTSAILVNTEKGVEVLSHIDLDCCEMSYKSVCLYNPALVDSADCNVQKRTQFFSSGEEHYMEEINQLTKESFVERFKKLISRVLFRIVDRDSLNIMIALITNKNK